MARGAPDPTEEVYRSIVQLLDNYRRWGATEATNRDCAFARPEGLGEARSIAGELGQVNETQTPLRAHFKEGTLRMGVRARIETRLSTRWRGTLAEKTSVDWRPPLNDVLRRERGAIQDPSGENASLVVSASSDPPGTTSDTWDGCQRPNREYQP